MKIIWSEYALEQYAATLDTIQSEASMEVMLRWRTKFENAIAGIERSP